MRGVTSTALRPKGVRLNLVLGRNECSTKIKDTVPTIMGSWLFRYVSFKTLRRSALFGSAAYLSEALVNALLAEGHQVKRKHWRLFVTLVLMKNGVVNDTLGPPA